jgi:hypothetical protein
MSEQTRLALGRQWTEFMAARRRDSLSQPGNEPGESTG